MVSKDIFFFFTIINIYDRLTIVEEIGMNNNIKIDISALLVTLNKLKLYKEEEEKLVDNIKNTLYKLENDYISKNNKMVKDKNKNICLFLDKLLKDKEKNIRYLENKIKYYNELDYEEYIKYHNLANSAKEE